MTQAKVFAFEGHPAADLLVDAVYEGGTHKSVKDDPLDPLVRVGNQGGFRYRGRIDGAINLCVLYSSMTDLDWPDKLDVVNGQFTYFGDNKRPGHELHETARGGNRVLSRVFHDLHSDRRTYIPPFFVFTKGPKGRDVVFRGLAAPGYPGLSQAENLVAVWRSRQGVRFQNYKAVFSMLDCDRVSREWINALISNEAPRQFEPAAWTAWRQQGQYRLLRADSVIQRPARADQLPKRQHELKLLNQIVEYFKQHPDREYAFERCAADLVRLHDSRFAAVDLTRPWRDGGRDAVGRYRIGLPQQNIMVDFAMEAKCKKPSTGNSSGVKDVARLLARLRHRQFGVFVTTSCIGDQAYDEVIEDSHPVLFLTGVHLIEILLHADIGTQAELSKWLRQY